MSRRMVRAGARAAVLVAVVALVLVVLDSVAPWAAALVGWLVTGYLVVRAAPAVAADLGRLPRLPRLTRPRRERADYL